MLLILELLNLTDLGHRKRLVEYLVCDHLVFEGIEDLRKSLVLLSILVDGFLETLNDFVSAIEILFQRLDVS